MQRACTHIVEERGVLLVFGRGSGRDVICFRDEAGTATSRRWNILPFTLKFVINRSSVCTRCWCSLRHGGPKEIFECRVIGCLINVECFPVPGTEVWSAFDYCQRYSSLYSCSWWRLVCRIHKEFESAHHNRKRTRLAKAFVCVCCCKADPLTT